MLTVDELLVLAIPVEVDNDDDEVAVWLFKLVVVELNIVEVVDELAAVVLMVPMLDDIGELLIDD